MTITFKIRIHCLVTSSKEDGPPGDFCCSPTYLDLQSAM
jgi:hypothetical protein